MGGSGPGVGEEAWWSAALADRVRSAEIGGVGGGPSAWLWAVGRAVKIACELATLARPTKIDAVGCWPALANPVKAAKIGAVGWSCGLTWEGPGTRCFRR